MVKRVTRRPILLAVASSLLLMVVLFITGLSVQHQMLLEDQKRAYEMAERVTQNNILIVKSMLEVYAQDVKRLDILYSELPNQNDALNRAIGSMLATDSSVVLSWNRIGGRYGSGITEFQQNSYLNDIPKGKPGRIMVSYSVANHNKHPLLRIYTSRNGKQGLVQVGLVVDLVAFHAKLLNIREMQRAYVTIITPDRFTLYHPDEKLIGTRDRELSDSLPLAGMLDTGMLQRSEQSQYLGVKVYRHSYPFTLGNERLLISVSVPNLETAEILVKNQLNTWLLIILPMVLFILLMFIGVLFWQKEMVKRKEMEKDVLKLQLQAEQQNKQMVTSELENLKSGINPHFLFNSLGSLVALIKRNPDQAVTFTRSLSSQYRYLLEMENRNVVPIAEEMEFTRNYIHIQSIRFGESIRFAAAVPPMPQQGVPPLAIQTLVENCIKHNMASVAHPLAIEIAVANGCITVTNNLNRRTGVVESTGKGLANLVKRYSYLTTKECRFAVEDGRYSASIPILEIGDVRPEVLDARH